MSAEGPSGSPPGGARRYRILLSLFFLLHWGSVAAYVLPANRASLDDVPAVVRPVATLVFPRYVRAVSPVAYPYLHLTTSRQHWTLFAPWPASYANSVLVVPYFPVPGGDVRAWVADTLLIRGAAEVPYPHFLYHRTYRILYNMGYEGLGEWYRPHFAAAMCRSLRSHDGRAPEGVGLVARWTRIELPWAPADVPPYEQWMGGFDCEPDDRAAGETPWHVYGLPDAIDVSGWPVVYERASSDVAAEATPDPAGSP